MLFDDVVEEEDSAEETHLFYTLTPLLYIFGTYRGFTFGENSRLGRLGCTADAPLRTGKSDSESFIEDILGVILLQLLESRIILTKQGFSLFLRDNTVFFLRSMV